MNAYRVVIDGTTCLVLMLFAMVWGHQAVKLLGHNQQLFRSQTKVALSSKRNSLIRRTRRQQIVNTWIIHLRCVAIFVFLMFVTIILYSLVGLGDISSLSYYSLNICLLRLVRTRRGIALKSVFNLWCKIMQLTVLFFLPFLSCGLVGNVGIAQYVENC